MDQLSKRCKQNLEKLSFIMRSIVNSIILGIVYIVGVGTTSIVARIFGVKFLDNSTKKQKVCNTQTYYKKLNLKKEEKENYLHQF